MTPEHRALIERIRRLFYEHAPVFPDFDEEEAVPDAEWSREGRHPPFGVMSIEFLARRVGEHAEEHAAQIAAATRSA